MASGRKNRCDTSNHGHLERLPSPVICCILRCPTLSGWNGFVQHAVDLATVLHLVTRHNGTGLYGFPTSTIPFFNGSYWNVPDVASYPAVSPSANSRAWQANCPRLLVVPYQSLQVARDSNGGEGNCHIARESVSKLRGPLSHARFGGCESPHEWIGDSI